MKYAVALSVVAVLFSSVAIANPIPDMSECYMELSNGGYGLASCPDGDGPAFQYINLYIIASDLTPVSGAQAALMSFDVTGCDVTITAVDDTSSSTGLIRYEVVADEACCCADGLAAIEIVSWVYTMIVDTDTLYANSFDTDCDGDVDPADFAAFAGDFGSTEECSDFDFDGIVDPVDFGRFSSHYGHP